MRKRHRHVSGGSNAAIAPWVVTWRGKIGRREFEGIATRFQGERLQSKVPLAQKGAEGKKNKKHTEKRRRSRGEFGGKP